MATNRASGNARVGLQAGQIDGRVEVTGSRVQVNGFTQNDAGTWTRNGISVGTPQVNPCGCYGAASFHMTATGRACSRCGKNY